jgi:uncharacterized RDD family membrane protein YckC
VKKYIGGLRIAAFLLDGLVTTVAVLLSGSLISFCTHKIVPTRIGPINTVWGLTVLLGIGYFLGRDGFTGRSFGKRLMGLHVARSDGGRCTFRSSFRRNLTLLVPGLNLLELWIFLRRPHEARIGDRFAGTRVEET